MPLNEFTKRENRLVCCSWFFVLCGSVLITIAVATPYWRVKSDTNEGIFQRCVEGNCKDIKIFDGQDKELDVVRILIVIGSGYMFLAIFLAILLCATSGYGVVLKFLAIVHISTALILYTATYAMKKNMDIAWCVYISWSGVLLYLNGLVLMTRTFCCKKETKEDVTKNMEDTEKVIENSFIQ